MWLIVKQKNKSIGTEPQATHILELAAKDFKITMRNTFKSPQERMITYIRLKNEEVWGDLETVKKKKKEEPHGKPRNEKITSEI